jgi:hypothetical protein
VLVRCAKGPEGDGAAAKLGEPALQLGLCGVMRQTAHVQNLAALREESADVSARIHWLCKDVGMILWRLALANKSTENACKSYSLFHSPAGRCWGKSLQVKREVVLDRRGRLDGLNLKRGTDVGEGAGAEGEALGMVCLPALVLGSEVKCARVL